MDNILARWMLPQTPNNPCAGRAAAMTASASWSLRRYQESWKGDRPVCLLAGLSCQSKHYLLRRDPQTPWIVMMLGVRETKGSGMARVIKYRALHFHDSYRLEVVMNIREEDYMVHTEAGVKPRGASIYMRHTPAMQLHRFPIADEDSFLCTKNGHSGSPSCPDRVADLPKSLRRYAST